MSRASSTNGPRRSLVLTALLTLSLSGGAFALGFGTDTRAAFAAARDSGRPLVLEFHATWCTACEQMRRGTWRDPRVLELLEDFVPLSVDGERNRNLQTRYAVEAYPTIVVADADGRVLLSLLGYQDAPAMAEHLAAVLENLDSLLDWTARSAGRRPDPEAWLGLADFALGRRAWAQAEALYRRTLGRQRGLDAVLVTRARVGLSLVLAETDRCREALRLVRGPAADAGPILERCGPSPGPDPADQSESDG